MASRGGREAGGGEAGTVGGERFRGRGGWARFEPRMRNERKTLGKPVGETRTSEDENKREEEAERGREREGESWLALVFEFKYQSIGAEREGERRERERERASLGSPRAPAAAGKPRDSDTVFARN